MVLLLTTNLLMVFTLKYTAATLCHWPFSPQLIQRTPSGSVLIRIRRWRADGAYRTAPNDLVELLELFWYIGLSNRWPFPLPFRLCLIQWNTDTHNLPGLEPNNYNKHNDWKINYLRGFFSNYHNAHGFSYFIPLDFPSWIAIYV